MPPAIAASTTPLAHPAADPDAALRPPAGAAWGGPGADYGGVLDRFGFAILAAWGLGHLLAPRLTVVAAASSGPGARGGA